MYKYTSEIDLRVVMNVYVNYGNMYGMLGGLTLTKGTRGLLHCICGRPWICGEGCDDTATLRSRRTNKQEFLSRISFCGPRCAAWISERPRCATRHRFRPSGRNSAAVPPCKPLSSFPIPLHVFPCSSSL